MIEQGSYLEFMAFQEYEKELAEKENERKAQNEKQGYFSSVANSYCHDKNESRGGYYGTP